MRPPLPTLSTDRPLLSTALGVRRFEVEDPLLSGQLLIGDQALAERAEALVWGGPFTPLRIERGPERCYVHLPERLLFSLADIEPLPAPAAFAIALRLAEALDRVHDNQVVHGHLHPDSVGFDALGRLRIAPALHHPLTRVEGQNPTPADDCLALGHLLAHMLGWTPPAWSEIPLEGVHARSARTILRGLLRERVRLRLSPARAVRQTLASLFARSQIADPDAALREWLGVQGLPQAQLDSPGKVVLPLAEMGESQAQRQVPEVTSAHQEGGLLAQVPVEPDRESLNRTQVPNLYTTNQSALEPLTADEQTEDPFSHLEESEISVVVPRSEPAIVRIGPDPSGEDVLVLELGEAGIESDESASLTLAEWDEEEDKTERTEVERTETEHAEAESAAAEEAAQLKAEGTARIEAERVEAERAEAKRAEAQRIEAQRIEAQRIEAQRLAEEEATRIETERIEAERMAAEEAARIEAQRIAEEDAARIEAERLAEEEATRIEATRIEAERLAAEAAARVEAERIAEEDAARIEAERQAEEEATRIEAERLAAEAAARIEAERIAEEEAVRMGAARLAEEAAARSRAERLEAEAAAGIAAVEAARIAAELSNAERLAAEEAARIETERLAVENTQRAEAERLAAEEAEEAERVEAERLATEEAARIAAEEAARIEEERLAAEAERVEAERVEAERVEAERVEAERVEAERVEAERVEEEQLDQAETDLEDLFGTPEHDHYDPSTDTGLLANLAGTQDPRGTELFDANRKRTEPWSAADHELPEPLMAPSLAEKTLEMPIEATLDSDLGDPADAVAAWRAEEAEDPDTQDSDTQDSESVASADDEPSFASLVSDLEEALGKPQTQTQLTAIAAKAAGPAPIPKPLVSVDKALQEAQAPQERQNTSEVPAPPESILERERGQSPAWGDADLGVGRNAEREQELGDGKWSESGRSAKELADQLPSTPVREMEIEGEDSGGRALIIGLVVAALLLVGLLWVLMGPKSAAPITLQTHPAGLRVSVDGQDLGKAPAQYDLPGGQGEHRVCAYVGEEQRCHTQSRAQLRASNPAMVDFSKE